MHSCLIIHEQSYLQIRQVSQRRESVEFQNYDSQDVESYPNTQPHRLMCFHNVKDMFFYGGTEVVKFDVFLYTNCVCVFENVRMCEADGEIQSFNVNESGSALGRRI